MPLLIGLILLVLAEISLFVVLGGAVGLWLTLAWVLGTGVAGVLILRGQGRHMVERLVDTALARHNPLRVAGDGMLVALAGVLLILPGFLTDLAGLVLLIPAVRAAILARIAAGARDRAADLAMRAMLHPGPRGAHGAGPMGGEDLGGGDVIDGSGTEVPPAPPHPGHRRPSGWTKP